MSYGWGPHDGIGALVSRDIRALSSPFSCEDPREKVPTKDQALLTCCVVWGGDKENYEVRDRMITNYYYDLWCPCFKHLVWETVLGAFISFNLYNLVRNSNGPYFIDEEREIERLNKSPKVMLAVSGKTGI
jgi:hypothetical protein